MTIETTPESSGAAPTASEANLNRHATAAAAWNKGRREANRIDATAAAVVEALGSFADRGASAATVSGLVEKETGAKLSDSALARVVDAHSRYLGVDPSVSYLRLALRAPGRKLAQALGVYDETGLAEAVSDRREVPEGLLKIVDIETAVAEVVAEPAVLPEPPSPEEENAGAAAEAEHFAEDAYPIDVAVAFVNSRSGSGTFAGTLAEGAGLSPDVARLALADAAERGWIRRISWITVPCYAPTLPAAEEAPAETEIHETSPERIVASEDRGVADVFSLPFSELKSRVLSSEDPSWLDQVAAAEVAGKDRKSVGKWIARRLRVLARANKPTEEPRTTAAADETALDPKGAAKLDELLADEKAEKERTDGLRLSLRSTLLGDAVHAAIGALHETMTDRLADAAIGSLHDATLDLRRLPEDRVSGLPTSVEVADVAPRLDALVGALAAAAAMRDAATDPPPLHLVHSTAPETLGVPMEAIDPETGEYIEPDEGADPDNLRATIREIVREELHSDRYYEGLRRTIGEVDVSVSLLTERVDEVEDRLGMHGTPAAVSDDGFRLAELSGRVDSATSEIERLRAEIARQDAVISDRGARIASLMAEAERKDAALASIRSALIGTVQ